MKNILWVDDIQPYAERKCGEIKEFLEGERIQAQVDCAATNEDTIRLTTTHDYHLIILKYTTALCGYALRQSVKSAEAKNGAQFIRVSADNVSNIDHRGDPDFLDKRDPDFQENLEKSILEKLQ